MYEFSIGEDGRIIGGESFPEFLYDKLTDAEIVEVRKYVSSRFSMGYWYRSIQ